MSHPGIVAIMHFAGSVIVPESVANPLKYYENNTARSRTLIETAITSSIRHFLFSSTATIYGLAEHFPIAETTPLAPINHYGRSEECSVGDGWFITCNTWWAGEH